MRVHMSRAEKLLLERLTGSFPGLSFLVKEVGISETSLKINFKKLYGLSPGQYFQKKQMILAREILKDQDIMIHVLAMNMGYHNQSKFAAAFRKHIGILPSEVQRNC